MSYRRNFGDIDIPIHYFISLDDRLVRADDVLEHYNLLKQHDKELAFIKVFQGFSHSDLTYGYNESLAVEF